MVNTNDKQLKLIRDEIKKLVKEKTNLINQIEVGAQFLTKLKARRTEINTELVELREGIE